MQVKDIGSPLDTNLAEKVRPVQCFRSFLKAADSLKKFGSLLTPPNCAIALVLAKTCTLKLVSRVSPSSERIFSFL